MKTFRLIALLPLILSAFSSMAQYYGVVVSGQVTQSPALLPYPGHKVKVEASVDPSVPPFTLVDSAYTNSTGKYSLYMNILDVPGTILTLRISTLDCQQILNQHFYWSIGPVGNYMSDFTICGDSVPASTCANYISINCIQGYGVNFLGGMYTPQAATYSWDFGDGSTGSGPDFTHVYAGPGTYPVTLTTLANGGCSYVSSQSLILYDTLDPVPCTNSIDYMSAHGLSVDFNGQMINNPPATYTWQFGDGTSGMGSGVVHSYAAGGTYQVSLTTVRADSCTFTSYGSVTVHDTLPPLPCDNYISVNSIQGLTVLLSGGMVNQQTAAYSWSYGDGTGGSGSQVTHTYGNPGTYTIILTTYTSDSCMDVTSQNITLSDSIPGCSDYFTAGAGISLYQVSFQGFQQPQMPASYIWNFGDQVEGTGQYISHTYAVQGTYLVTLTTMDSTGCTSQYSAFVYVYDYSANTIMGRVFADNQPVDNCLVQLFRQDQSGNLNLVEEAYTDSAYYYKFSYLSSGLYRILAVPDSVSTISGLYLPTYYGDAYLWTNSTAVMLGYPINPYDIHLFPLDSISTGIGTISGLINTGGKSVISAYQEVLLLSEQGNPDKVAYTDVQGNYSFSQLPFGNYEVHPNITGIYTIPVYVQLTAVAPNATVNLIIQGNTITGIQDETTRLCITNFYPNPVASTLFVEVNSRIAGTGSLEILDETGRVILQKTCKLTGDKQLIELLLPDFVKGIYFLRLSDANGNMMGRKFLKN